MAASPRSLQTTKKSHASKFQDFCLVAAFPGFPLNTKKSHASNLGILPRGRLPLLPANNKKSHAFKILDFSIVAAPCHVSCKPQRNPTPSKIRNSVSWPLPVSCKPPRNPTPSKFWNSVSWPPPPCPLQTQEIPRLQISRFLPRGRLPRVPFEH